MVDRKYVLYIFVNNNNNKMGSCVHIERCEWCILIAAAHHFYWSIKKKKNANKNLFCWRNVSAHLQWIVMVNGESMHAFRTNRTQWALLFKLQIRNFAWDFSGCTESYNIFNGRAMISALLLSVGYPYAPYPQMHATHWCKLSTNFLPVCVMADGCFMAHQMIGKWNIIKIEQLIFCILEWFDAFKRHGGCHRFNLCNLFVVSSSKHAKTCQTKLN